MIITADEIKNKLAQVIDPNTGKDYVSARCVKDIQIFPDEIQISIELGYPARSKIDEITRQIHVSLTHLVQNMTVKIHVSSKISTHAVQHGIKPLPNVKNIIAVASGKGGVGKSTTAVNLALALFQEGARVGILDADIYGPSQPMMMGIDGRPQTQDGKTMKPLKNYGIEVSSIGFLINPEDAMIWRGPMVTQALLQLLNQTQWGDLDYLIVDLPPGTGDIQLTLSQKVPVTGAVIVTTPQDISLLDARRGLRMFEKVGIPILGIVENMAIHICSNCGHTEHIFGKGGGASMCAHYDVELLGSLPLEKSIRESADLGQPIVLSFPLDTSSRVYREIAHKLATKIAIKPRDLSGKIPHIVIKKD